MLNPSHVKEPNEKRTVLNHFNKVRALVVESNVMPYGDFSVGQDKLSSYIGKPSKFFPKPITFRNDRPSYTTDNVDSTTSYYCAYYQIKIWSIRINYVSTDRNSGQFRNSGEIGYIGSDEQIRN